MIKAICNWHLWTATSSRDIRQLGLQHRTHEILTLMISMHGAVGMGSTWPVRTKHPLHWLRSSMSEGSLLLLSGFLFAVCGFSLKACHQGFEVWKDLQRSCSWHFWHSKFLCISVLLPFHCIRHPRLGLCSKERQTRSSLEDSWASVDFCLSWLFVDGMLLLLHGLDRRVRRREIFIRRMQRLQKREACCVHDDVDNTVFKLLHLSSLKVKHLYHRCQRWVWEWEIQTESSNSMDNNTRLTVNEGRELFQRSDD